MIHGHKPQVKCRTAVGAHMSKSVRLFLPPGRLTKLLQCCPKSATRLPQVPPWSRVHLGLLMQTLSKKCLKSFYFEFCFDIASAWQNVCAWKSIDKIAVATYCTKRCAWALAFYLGYYCKSSAALIWTKRKHANTLYAFPLLLQQGNSKMKMALD